jgi:hypothetical protein
MRATEVFALSVRPWLVVLFSAALLEAHTLAGVSKPSSAVALYTFCASAQIDSYGFDGGAAKRTHGTDVILFGARTHLSSRRAVIPTATIEQHSPKLAAISCQSDAGPKDKDPKHEKQPTALPETNTLLILTAELLVLGFLFFWRRNAWV